SIHPAFQTPSIAIAGVTVATLAGLVLGDSLLVPVTEVGSMACACGWFAACISFFLVETRPGARLIAAIGAVVALLLVAMKVIPKFPGHFSLAEWMALVIWLLIGIAMHLSRPRGASKVS